MSTSASYSFLISKLFIIPLCSIIKLSQISGEIIQYKDLG
jgi:hypothetical protein